MKRNVFIFVFALLISASLMAQDFEVAPARLAFSVEPGESQTRVVTIRNHGNKVETVNLQLNDFITHRDGRRETLSGGSTRHSISNWVNLNPTFVELQPNESKNIQVNLISSTDDHAAKWGILSFVSAVERTAFSADAEMQTGMSISGRIDIFLFYNPLTDTKGRVDIGNLQEVESKAPDYRTFTVNLDNIGDLIVNCDVYLLASNMATGEEHRFRTVEVITYPQSMRTVELRLPMELPSGKYALAAILDYPGSESLKGTQITIDVK